MQQKRLNKMFVVFGSLVVYIVSFPFLYSLLYNSSIILSLLPIIFFAAKYGSSGGLSMGLLLVGLNGTLLHICGIDIKITLMDKSYWIIHSIYFIFGGLLGYMHELKLDLKHIADENEKLKHILPVCPFCSKVKNVDGEWEYFDAFIAHSCDSDNSKHVCPICEKIPANNGASGIESGISSIDNNNTNKFGSI